MCGIAGIVWTRPEAEPELLARSMLRLLEHRGPDDHGWLTLAAQRVRLGRGQIPPGRADALLLHRRLSILDLSEGGWQPMASADGRHFLVFNGEIYNYVELRAELAAQGHVFRTQSDSEVLLHALTQWGASALPRLVGMFALALLDVQARRLFLARDCFGIKPLYYTRQDGRLAFASEIKALLALPGLPRQPNPARLFDYLRHGRTDHGGETLFAGIHQIPAAHFAEIALDRPEEVCPTRYWRVDLADRLDVSFPEATQRVRELFLDNIRLHLRSDVPVGAALSGGIDSSAIVTAMRAVAPTQQIHAFSYVAEDHAINEERWIDIAGERAQAIVHKVQPTPDELVGDLDSLVYLQDEPFGSTSIYAQNRVFRLAGETGIKVMLDGQGADELLGGYRPYLAARLVSLLGQGRVLQAGRFLQHAARLPGTGGLMPLLMQSSKLMLPASVQGVARRLAGKHLQPAWLTGGWFAERGVRLAGERPGLSKQALRQQLYRTLAETSLPALLRYEDRNAMAHSIESRVPFLTPALVDFVMRLPEEHLIGRDGTSKRVFRQAMRGIVPDAILDRRDKIGFATPERGWLARLRPWLEKTLSSETARRIPVLDGPAMHREWRAILTGRRPFDFRVWRWVNLIRWTERFDVQFGDRACA